MSLEVKTESCFSINSPGSLFAATAIAVWGLSFRILFLRHWLHFSDLKAISIFNLCMLVLKAERNLTSEAPALTAASQVTFISFANCHAPAWQSANEITLCKHP